MSVLEVNYAGMLLSNPFIVSSSPLTASVKAIEKSASAGAGAVVLKSLFEEQIMAQKPEANNLYVEHPEAAEYFNRMTGLHHPDTYLSLIEKVSKEVDVPIIASLNCNTNDWWVEYASQIETAGADVLELNISFLPLDHRMTSSQVDDHVISIIKAVKAQTKNPIVVKLGPYYSSLINLVDRISKLNIAGIVLFNRFFRPDINIEKMTITASSGLSSSEENLVALRWVGIISSLYPDLDLSTSSGIHNGTDAIKMFLAGAKTVQLYSTLIQNGFRQLGKMKEELSEWMDRHQFETMDEVVGKIPKETDVTSSAFDRLQYVRAISPEGQEKRDY